MCHSKPGPPRALAENDPTELQLLAPQLLPHECKASPSAHLKALRVKLGWDSPALLCSQGSWAPVQAARMLLAHLFRAWS